MSQDLRELFKNKREAEQPKIKQGHQDRFLARLEEELPIKRNSTFLVLKIAATALLLITASYFGFKKLTEVSSTNETVVDVKDEAEEDTISLGDLSPDLKKVETYYVANINLELSKLEFSPDTKAMVDSFMNQLEDLDAEYGRLNIELNQIGPNDQTIAALIQNLQLRLQLLQKLKKKLNSLKTSKNEQIETSTI